jgi:hypothetical protein
MRVCYFIHFFLMCIQPPLNCFALAITLAITLVHVIELENDRGDVDDKPPTADIDDTVARLY